MTAEEKDPVGDALDRGGVAIEQLQGLLGSQRIGMYPGSSLIREVGWPISEALKQLHDALVLIERDHDDRLKRLEGSHGKGS